MSVPFSIFLVLALFQLCVVSGGLESLQERAACRKCNPKAMAPVCASNKQVYPNPCFVFCQDDINIVPWAQCPRCNRYCFDSLQPVCGSDDIIYRNRCVLLENSCKYQGKLIEMPKQFCCQTCKGSSQLCELLCRHAPILVPCDKACTLQYEPVCGSDGFIYGNKCVFDIAVCKSNGTLTKGPMERLCCSDRPPSCPY